MPVEGFDLSGKRALVAGPDSPISRAAAEALTEAGARVLGLTGGDLTAPGAADRLVVRAAETLGGLDIVVSCCDRRQAGPFVELTDDEWDQLVMANLTAPLRLVRAAGRAMLPRGGRIVCVASLLGERGLPNAAAYGACQAGLIQLIRGLALEWARSGIRINGLGLGWLEGDPLLDPAATAALVKYLPMRRLGRPEEIGPLAVYLASDAADLMTGQTIFVDGAVMAHA